jgi:hypothetical protein
MRERAGKSAETFFDDLQFCATFRKTIDHKKKIRMKKLTFYTQKNQF